MIDFRILLKINWRHMMSLVLKVCIFAFTCLRSRDVIDKLHLFDLCAIQCLSLTFQFAQEKTKEHKDKKKNLL